MQELAMTKVSAGTFRMGGGDLKNRPDALPVHNVTISTDFYIAKEPITYSAFAQFYQERYKTELDAQNYQGYVIGISWYEANEYCQWLSAKTGKLYRLPTEAEWEYCVRNSQALDLDRMGDLHFREWCFDWYDVYSSQEENDPAGPDQGHFKVVRGGFLDDPARFNTYNLDVWTRASLPPNYRHYPDDIHNEFGRHSVGFRVVQGLPVKTNGKIVNLSTSFGVKQDKPPAQVCSDNPYFRKRYLFPIPPDNASSEEIYALGLNPSLRHHNHSPGFDVAPNGDLLVSIYSSYWEYDAEVGLMGARLKYGCDQWEMPDMFCNPVGVNDHAPLMFTDHDGTIYHFWGWPQLENAFPFQYIYSKDSGATWSEVQFPKFINQAEKVMSQPINSVVHGQDGYYYVACDVKGAAASVLWRSPDLVNWESPQGTTAGRHSTIVELNDGRLLAMGGKNSQIDGFMPQAISSDRGDSWEVSKTPFAGMTSGQRPCITRLQSGRLFMCGDFQNKQGQRPPCATDDNWGSYVAYSEDDGQTWQIKKLWGTQKKKKGSGELADAHTIGYSVCRQSQDGLIHVITSNTHPCLHLCFNEAWLLADTDDAFPSDDVLMQDKVTNITQIETFTERYSNDQIKCKYSGGIADDGRFLLHGQEQWFYPSGELMSHANFNYGVRVGEYTYYAKNGKKIWEWEYLGENTEIYKTYHPNNVIRTIGRFENRVAEGLAMRYAPDGKLVTKVLFEQGKIV